MQREEIWKDLTIKDTGGRLLGINAEAKNAELPRRI